MAGDEPAAYADVAVDLPALLPGARWLAVGEHRDAARDLASRLGVDAAPLGLDRPGDVARLGATGADDVVLVGVGTGWVAAAATLCRLASHPGPVVALQDGASVTATAPLPEPGGGRWPLVVRDRDGASRPAVLWRAHDAPWPTSAAAAASAGRVARTTSTTVAHGSADRHGAGARASAASPSRPLVDVRRTNPIGWQVDAAAPVTAGVDEVDDLVEAARRPGEAPWSVRVRVGDDAAAAARAVVTLAATGLPVLLDGPAPAVTDRLSPALRDALPGAGDVAAGDVAAGDVAAGDVAPGDPWRREAIGVRLRRAALRDHDAGRPPGTAGVAVSVLLVSRRPEVVRAAACTVLRQTHRPLQLVVVGHGAGVVDRLAGLPTGDVELVTREVDPDVPFGAALAVAADAADGEVVTKLDDDDHYASTHVEDLVLALRYSGATVVGKGAQLIHLAGPDVTVQRHPGDHERYGRHLAGGTLALHAADLVAVGGWASVHRAVDTRLFDAVRRHGGSRYRTHPWGFVLARHGGGHTYATDDTRFLRRSRAQRPGLDLAFAGVDLPPAGHPPCHVCAVA